MRPTRDQLENNKIIWDREYMGYAFSGDYTNGLIMGIHIGNDSTEADLTGAALVGKYINCRFNTTLNNANYSEAELISCKMYE